MQQNVPEFLDLLKALNDASVRYVVVGGLAMVLHGSSYVTFDFDFALDLRVENISATVKALAPFHPHPHQYGTGVPFVWDERSFFGPVVELVTDLGQVDILRTIPAINSFEQLWERSELRQIGNVAARVASIDDLIAMKREANRPKDIDHIRQLEALNKLRRDEEL